MSYTKGNKLITAMYMVTDIIDKDEPIRNKLRTLGTEILSDIHSLTTPVTFNLNKKISEVISFLDIAYTVGMISEMNRNILKKEFSELSNSFIDFCAQYGSKVLDKSVFLTEDFFEEQKETENLELGYGEKIYISKGHTPKGHAEPTRIGVQKGSTLMKAISDKLLKKTTSLVVAKPAKVTTNNPTENNFEILRTQRREEIINIIKAKKEATIKDIKDSARGVLVSCGGKTLQRELISMVHDHVLYKTGEKRWSRYFLPARTTNVQSGWPK